jgi:hypothetical protein
MSAQIWSKKEEIESLTMERPHLVILGAGASYASFPNGDKNGKKLPLMSNFVQILGLEKLLEENNIHAPYNDFEAIYSDITVDETKQELKEEIEQRIQNYFYSLELPDSPTLYDHLVLSLRPKDVIATFNWDPFLAQAIMRNISIIEKPPTILFLHGNVTYAYCAECKVGYPLKDKCIECGKPLLSAPLLYPVKEKNYQTHPVIKAHWKGFEHYLKQAWAVTIFGYSAPKTDVEAIDIMKKAWGETEERNLEQIEIIDIQKEDQLIETWNPFIHTHHYDVHRSFYDSIIAKFPRRSGEALWAQLMECKWLDPQDFPQNANFSELYENIIPKLEVEYREQKS